MCRSFDPQRSESRERVDIGKAPNGHSAVRRVLASLGRTRSKQHCRYGLRWQVGNLPHEAHSVCRNLDPQRAEARARVDMGNAPNGQSRRSARGGVVGTNTLKGTLSLRASMAGWKPAPRGTLVPQLARTWAGRSRTNGNGEPSKCAGSWPGRYSCPRDEHAQSYGTRSVPATLRYGTPTRGRGCPGACYFTAATLRAGRLESLAYRLRPARRHRKVIDDRGPRSP